MDYSFDTIKKLFLKNNYFVEDELIWQTYLDIEKSKKDSALGQNIHAICLEGPSGAGKTEYARTYTKILNEIYEEEVKLIEYQCDYSTGKSNLYEEIKISSAVIGSGDDVIIPGVLIQAIEEVKKGKKVILFLDEYEKSRAETDTLLYDFLQDGKINTTQSGNLEIPQKYMNNIQFIICTNKERELSKPLERRLEIVRLEAINPKNLMKVINNELKDSNKDIADFVNILYAFLYSKKDEFTRIPSCSECLQAINSGTILYDAKAPTQVIYKKVISTILKNEDDQENLMYLLDKQNKFEEYINKIYEMTDYDKKQKYQVTMGFFRELFSDELEENKESKDEAKRLENEYLKARIEEKNKMIAKQKHYIEELLEAKTKGSSENIINEVKTEIDESLEIKTIAPYTGDYSQEERDVIKIGESFKLVGEYLPNENRQTIGLVEAENVKVKESILDANPDMTNNFGTITFDIDLQNPNPRLFEKHGIMDQIRYAIKEYEMLGSILSDNSGNTSNLKIYKDGVLIYDENDIQIGFVRVLEKITINGMDDSGIIAPRYKLMSNRLVLPVYAFEKLYPLFHECYSAASDNSYGGSKKRRDVITNINCLIADFDDVKQRRNTKHSYDKRNIKLAYIHIAPNIYSFEFNDFSATPLFDEYFMIDDYLNIYERRFNENDKKALNEISKKAHIELSQNKTLGSQNNEIGEK